MTAYIFDTETTDSDPKTAQIVEAAWIRYKDLTSWHARFQPMAPIKLGALATHHITPEELVNCPPHTDFRLPADMEYMIGHNIDFDWQVAGSLPEIKRICTLAIARALLPDVDSHSQSALMYHFLGSAAKPKLVGAHSAAEDVKNCLELFSLLIGLSKRKFATMEEIWQFSEECRLPTRMTFGKHKGEPIASVPRSYAEWYARQPDPDVYLIEAFKRARKL